MSNDHAELRSLLRDLIERHGGIEQFSPIQLEIANAVVGLMIGMRSANGTELTKHADVLVKLTTQLPPIAPKRTGPRRSIRELVIGEAVALYTKFIGGEEDPEDYETGIPETPPTEPVEKPKPAGPPSYPAPSKPHPRALNADYAPLPDMLPADHCAGAVTIYQPPPDPPQEPPGPEPDIRLRRIGAGTTQYFGV